MGFKGKKKNRYMDRRGVVHTATWFPKSKRDRYILCTGDRIVPSRKGDSHMTSAPLTCMACIGFPYGMSVPP